MEPHAVVREYQRAYEKMFGANAPDVRVSCAGGYYVRHPVNKQFTEADIRKVTRFYQRGVE